MERHKSIAMVVLWNENDPPSTSNKETSFPVATGASIRKGVFRKKT